jgi:hypothetical protein
MRGLRLLVTTLLGFVFGIVCWLLVTSGQPGMPTSMSWSIILNCAILGFVIGISAWKINYMLHGIILGFIITIPMSLALLAQPEMSFKIFWGTMIMGMIYGFLIELITHAVVKEKKTVPESSTL